MKPTAPPAGRLTGEAPDLGEPRFPRRTPRVPPLRLRRLRYLRVVIGLAALALVTASVVVALTQKDASSVAGGDVAPGIDLTTANLINLQVDGPNRRRPAPDFTLTDQNGVPKTLSQFRGDAVVMSVNDDECTDLCTLFAEDVIAADKDMGAAASHVVFLAVNANQFHPQVSAVKTWTSDNNLDGVPNWYFVTGSPAQLSAVWKDYGATVELDQAHRTVIHSTLLTYIDHSGQEVAIGDYGMNSADTDLLARAMAQMAVDSLPAAERVSVAGPAVPPSSAPAALGAQAPAFTLPLLVGSGRLSLASLHVKPVVVNFWSSTCIPCGTEMPALERAYRDFAGRVSFVGVDVYDGSGAGGRSLAGSAGTTYPLVSDPSGSVADRYLVGAVPYSVIVGSNGQILVRHPGAFTTEQVEYLIQDYYPDLVPKG